MGDGEVFDCVDENKQPAFDHPLLKNHKIRSRPTSSPLRASNGTFSSSSSATQSPKMVNLRRVKCPEGTVPIRRTSKEDLIRIKAFMESSELVSPIVHPNDDYEVKEPPGRHIAAYHSLPATEPDQHLEFHGIQAMMTVENPSVGPTQRSVSLVWLESGPNDSRNALQAGWMVSPQVFGDNKTHISVLWVSSTSGCYNIQCTGFVQKHRDYYVGQVIEHTSQYDGAQYAMGAYIHQDAGTGDWWFTIYGGKMNADIGYWPREVVPHLGAGADLMVWGGLVYNHPHETSPPMGNGHFPDGNPKTVAVMYDMHYLDGNYASAVPVIWSDFGRRQDNDNCYTITRNDFDETYRYNIFFGGPGGNCD
ncbi:hypothetical protein C5167_023565 [Papaver somniferum]|uniref:Neprosin PEP catalytic domain-containing protein n=1 Tax=Papaver somniferum TaxID=3469 RepID=A0A4Y7JMM7_PAPSO|nr:uncharacterized protein LOC113277772 [Papaver somniferum]RZC61826.1 hypothetical protein C5167_023565 [Papaver somniferum]